MSYCKECFELADVCFCNIEKVILSEYVDEMRECEDLKCYCKKHTPNKWFFGLNPKFIRDSFCNVISEKCICMWSF
jgi:transposase